MSSDKKTSNSKPLVVISATLLGSAGLALLYSMKGNSAVSLNDSFLSPGSEHFQEYLQFVAKYGKTNMDEEEFYLRFGVFQKNYQRIIDHNAIEDAGFDLEVNQFADLTDEEFVKGRTGLVVPEARSQKMRGKAVDGSLNIEPIVVGGAGNTSAPRALKSKFPDHKNWYKDGFVTEPYDQGMCGGCWAFSVTSAVESLAKIAGKVDKLEEFSVQQLLDCGNEAIMGKFQNYGCVGGWMYQGFAYVSQEGQQRKLDYPKAYSQRSTLKCEADHSKAVHMKDIGYVEHDGRTNEELKELLQTQPVSVGIYTTGMLAAYKSGVVTDEFLHCSYKDREVNHGVVLVGYGKVTSKDRVRGRCKEYWVIRNSWGSSWGEHGFFRMCADGTGSKKLPVGMCLVNRYTTWPTMNKADIDPDFEI